MEENLPFSYVESKSFRRLLSLCNPQIDQLLIGADSVAEKIGRKYLSIRERVKQVLINIDCSINLTIDGWTSPNGLSVLGVTGHWVDDKWKLRECLLDAAEIIGDHSGQNLASHLITSLNAFEIQSKVFCITGDNASSNRTLAKELAAKLSHFTTENMLGCVAHVINLAAKAGIGSLDRNWLSRSLDTEDLAFLDDDNDAVFAGSDAVDPARHPPTETLSPIKKIHDFVVAVRRSPQKQQAFSTLSGLVHLENPHISQLSLVLDVETRWNSTYAMLERGLKLRKAFDVYCTTESSCSKWVLSAEDWEKVEVLCMLLKPLSEITEVLSKSKYPTLSTVLPYYQGLIEQIGQ